MATKKEAMQKFIVVPPDEMIEVGSEPSGKPIYQPFTFYRHFLCRTILSDKVFGTNYETILMAAAIRGLFDGKRAGQKVPIGPDHLEKLQQVTKNPSEGYQPIIMAQCIPFIQAILNPVAEE